MKDQSPIFLAAGQSPVSIDTGHFFHTSLTQCLVFLGILEGQESELPLDFQTRVG